VAQLISTAKQPILHLGSILQATEDCGH